MALIASTAGLLPRRPVADWEKADVSADWQKLRGQFFRILNPLVLKIERATDYSDDLQYFKALRSGISRNEENCQSIQEFENAGNKCNFSNLSPEISLFAT